MPNDTQINPKIASSLNNIIIIIPIKVKIRLSQLIERWGINSSISFLKESIGELKVISIQYHKYDRYSYV